MLTPWEAHARFTGQDLLYYNKYLSRQESPREVSLFDLCVLSNFDCLVTEASNASSADLSLEVLISIIKN